MKEDHLGNYSGPLADLAGSSRSEEYFVDGTKYARTVRLKSLTQLYHTSSYGQKSNIRHNDRVNYLATEIQAYLEVGLIRCKGSILRANRELLPNRDNYIGNDRFRNVTTPSQQSSASYHISCLSELSSLLFPGRTRTDLKPFLSFLS